MFVLFLPIKIIDSVDKLGKLYVSEVLTLHGVLVSIVSDRDPQFTSRLWQSIQHVIDTKLDLSIVFHLKTNRQLERMIRYLKIC